jgi:hypothetical protein
MFSILGVSTPNEKELFVSPSGTSTHPSAAHELTIELTPPLRVGVYRGAIEIRTDREEEESITVQVCAFVSKPE